MAAKYQLITELYRRTGKAVTGNPQAWQNFLASACRNYKCRFDEQLLIYAQRPDAVAVAGLETWNRQFKRACFVSWCADQCGYLESGIIPKFSLCSDGVDWFNGNGQWQGKDYEPQAGDIIFFDWSNDGQDGEADHVGIVEKCENGTVYTVEGNSGDACKQNSYPVGYYEILGYGVPKY